PNTSSRASDAPTSALAFNNRGLDFTNRAADLNPDDIESLTVLKGPEAAALYGIDAANGAVVITTKRGRSGGGFDYTSTYRLEQVRAKPVVQNVYGPSGARSTHRPRRGLGGGQSVFQRQQEQAERQDEPRDLERGRHGDAGVVGVSALQHRG